MTYALGFVPLQFSIHSWRNLPTLVSASFLHGGAFHLIGNCLFLWIFGRSLEKLFGPKTYLALFSLAGAVGFLLHWAVNAAENVPVIGASASISTIIGMYLALFPKAKIRSLLILGWFFRLIDVPAWGFIIYWAGLQFLAVLIPGSSEPVAYYAHIGGFIVGVIGAILWKVTMPMSEEILQAFDKNSFQENN